MKNNIKSTSCNPEAVVYWKNKINNNNIKNNKNKKKK